jgi:hypothetical protein
MQYKYAHIERVENQITAVIRSKDLSIDRNYQ